MVPAAAESGIEQKQPATFAKTEGMEVMLEAQPSLGNANTGVREASVETEQGRGRLDQPK